MRFDPSIVTVNQSSIVSQIVIVMTTAQVVETSDTVNNNSPIQDYVHPDDQTQPTFEKTPGFKPFTFLYMSKNPPKDILFFLFFLLKDLYYIYCFKKTFQLFSRIQISPKGVYLEPWDDSDQNE